MPLLKGEPLSSRLKTEGKLSVNEAVRIAREIAEGLAAAHEQGLIHRDVKPGNIWLEGQKHRVRILDFGLVRADDHLSDDEEASLTQEGLAVGTPAYMSPEQARGKHVDGRTDVFSLGALFYQMLTGELPFKGDSTLAVLASLAIDDPIPPSDIEPAVPPYIEELVSRMLRKEREERPSAADVATELAAFNSTSIGGGKAADPGFNPFQDLDATAQVHAARPLPKPAEPAVKPVVFELPSDSPNTAAKSNVNPFDDLDASPPAPPPRTPAKGAPKAHSKSSSPRACYSAASFIEPGPCRQVLADP